MDYSDAPQVLRDFLIYHETICGHSKATVDQYYLDLRMFLRFLKRDRGLTPRTAELDEISIADVDISFLRTVTLTEVYSFLAYLSRDRVKQPNAHELEYGLSANSRARKIAAIRSFFKYLTVKAKLLEENPVQDLDSPKIPKTLPHYLTLEESKRLLSVVDGKNKERDYCILCIFLNCGLRISELVGLNLQDDHGDSLRILGKGSKERVVYLNDACREALDRYLAVRSEIARLLDDVLHIAGAVAAADKGDGTEGAEVIAALGDAQICPARTGGDNAGYLVNGGAVVAEGACTSPRHYGVCRTDDIAEAADAEHGVNFRHFGHDAVLISLGKTAGDDKPAELARLLELRHFKDVVDSLTLRSVNKAAGVHDSKVGSLRIGDESIACLAHEVEHLFAVDKILGTAKRDHRKGFFHGLSVLYGCIKTV